ncbi:hypothetical protein HY612_00385 [Candidatus Roizmanbacteria bacterium]|nr:hypothetical protein [Candidatus Roizmanbacteria bacterium]
MKVFYTKSFQKSLNSFIPDIQRKFEKQINYLLLNLKHPSLKAKKYDEARGIWQARVDKGIRFYFMIEENSYILLDIIKYPK